MKVIHEIRRYDGDSNTEPSMAWRSSLIQEKKAPNQNWYRCFAQDFPLDRKIKRY
jgi:hypothetical protein